MLSSLYRPVLVSRGLSSSLRVRCVTTSSLSLQQAATKPQTKPFNAIPGPRPLPLIGNTLDVLKIRRSGGRLSDYHIQGLEKYGGIMKMSLPGAGKMVMVADPDVIEEVLRAEGKYPVRDVAFTQEVKWFLEQAGRLPAFTILDGEAWKRGRMAAIKPTHPANVNRHIDSLSAICARFPDYLRRTRNKDNLIEDFTPLAKRLTMQATAKFVYDIDVDFLGNPKKEDFEYLDTVDGLFKGIGGVMNELPIHRVFPNKLYRSFKHAIEECYRLSLGYIENFQERLERGESSEAQVMLEQWLKEKNMSTEEAVSLSMGMLLAGIHTTSSQSTFLLFEMAKNPEAQEKLYQEIQTVLGDRPPTAQDLEDMKYMRGCIKECFRVRSVTQGITRVLKEDAVIHGYHVPAGVLVMYSNYAAAMNEKIFEDPTQFKPERWIRKDGPQQHPFAILPFGFGPRNCYGKRFAELEMRLLLIEVIQNFRLETEMVDMKMAEDSFVTTPAESVRLNFIDRS